MPPKVPTSAGADEAAEHFRRLVERAHRVNDAEHRSDDAQRRQAVGDRLEGVRRLLLLVMQRLDLLVHQRLDLVALGVADDDDAAVVADEGDEIGVGEQLRIALEDLAVLGIVEMAFHFAARFGSELAHQGVQHAQHVEIVAGLRHLVGDRLDEGLAAILDG